MTVRAHLEQKPLWLLALEVATVLAVGTTLTVALHLADWSTARIRRTIARP